MGSTGQLHCNFECTTVQILHSPWRCPELEQCAHYVVNADIHDSITDKMCTDWVAEMKNITNLLEPGVPKVAKMLLCWLSCCQQVLAWLEAPHREHWWHAPHREHWWHAVQSQWLKSFCCLEYNCYFDWLLSRCFQCVAVDYAVHRLDFFAHCVTDSSDKKSCDAQLRQTFHWRHRANYELKTMCDDVLPIHGTLDFCSYCYHIDVTAHLCPPLTKGQRHKVCCHTREDSENVILVGHSEWIGVNSSGWVASSVFRWGLNLRESEGHAYLSWLVRFSINQS